jgi:hypothetical protein
VLRLVIGGVGITAGVSPRGFSLTFTQAGPGDHSAQTSGFRGTPAWQQ